MIQPYISKALLRACPDHLLQGLEWEGVLGTCAHRLVRHWRAPGKRGGLYSPKHVAFYTSYPDEGWSIAAQNLDDARRTLAVVDAIDAWAREHGELRFDCMGNEYLALPEAA